MTDFFQDWIQRSEEQRHIQRIEGKVPRACEANRKVYRGYPYDVRV